MGVWGVVAQVYEDVVLISARSWAEIENYFRYAPTRLRDREAQFSSANSCGNRCEGVIILR